MNLTPRSPGRLPRFLAAALLLPWLPLTGQTLVNGNFDAQPTFTNFPGYAVAPNPTTITGWTLSNNTRIGLNGTGGPFWSTPCGPIPSAPNCVFIQASGGPNSISQTVTDLTIGTKYIVSARISARSGNTPSLVFSTDGNGPTVKLEVIAPPSTGPLATTTAFRTASFQFVATAASHLITFTNDRASGDHTLLLDDVTVAPAATSSSWSFAQWTGDATSGVDPQYVYTHAHHLHAPGGVFNATTWQPININGVNFNLGDTPGSNRFTLTNLTANYTNVVPNNLTGQSAKLSKDFRFDGPNTGITLQNLKPNTQYVFTLYGVGFDATAYRSATFSSSVPGSDKFSANLSQYGQGNGLLVNYTYTTDASATPVTISYPTHGSGTFHTSGFSNREAVPSTPPVVWTAQPWTDDATSGVSPNHVYTHALKFGAATNVHVNGVNFTGVAGPNPAAANYTSAGLNGVVNNDVNNVTGYSSTLAKDFVYGGIPETHNLSGLTPGKNYVFTLYTVGWSDGTRRAALIGGTGEGSSVLNQDALGDNNGQRFEYQYTASASGTATITVSGLDVGAVAPFDRKSFHTYGISNREADAMVGVAPSFTLQPVGNAIGLGSDYVLRAGATGSATLTYQWKKNGTDVPGATSTELLLEDVDSGDTATYTVVVSNGIGSPVTSNNAAVSVLENVPGVFNTGVGVDGQALATGAIDPHYALIINPDSTESTTALVQNAHPAWLANSTTSKWIGPRADTAGAAAMSVDDGEGLGTYVYRTQIDLTGFDVSTVQISGSWASDNSGLALRVNGAATGITNTAGSTFGVYQSFTINTTNAPGLIAGVNNIDFVINNADVSVGYTGLRVENFRAIGVIPPGTSPHIAVQPQGTVGPHGGTVNLVVGASGSAPVAYQWYKDNVLLSGEQSATLSIAIDEVADGGDYKVRVSNGSGFVDSNIATVTVGNAVPIAVEDSFTTDEGQALEIDVIFEMLDNDSDADNDVLTLAGFSATSFNGGTVTEDEGVLTYTPAPGFDGLDGFTYTVSDGWGGTSTTANVVITVNNVSNPAPGPMTLAVNLAGSTVTGTFTGAPGASYTLQRSTTLETGSWTDIDTEVAPPSGTVEVTDNAPPAGKAFYRISYTP